MKVIKSNFIVKGYKNGNVYYIVKNKMGRFDVYQALRDSNKNTTAKDIKMILPSFEHLSDEAIMVRIPDEEYACFLLLHDTDTLEMNGFRLTLEREEFHTLNQ